MFFGSDTAPPEIYPLSLHDALPISFLARAGLVAEPPTAEQRRVLETIAPLAQERMIVLSDAAGLLGFLFVDDVDIDPAAADRKSTRLNSSHANISYSVFCLKKKVVN